MAKRDNFLARLGESLLCNGILPGTDFPAPKPKQSSSASQTTVKS